MCHSFLKPNIENGFKIG